MDWDNDGTRDLVLGANSSVVVYRNGGTEDSPRFEEPFTVRLDVSGCDGVWIGGSSISVTDINDDGLPDLLFPSENNINHGVIYFLNVGSQVAPEFGQCNVLKVDGEALKLPRGITTPLPVDWNGDGNLDLMMGGGAALAARPRII